MRAADKSCPECYCYGGHLAYCRTKGYQFESAPPEPPAGDPHAHLGPAPEGLCCGESRSRAGCEYHDPRLQPKPARKEKALEASPMKPGLTEPPSYDEMVKQLTARWHRTGLVSGDLCRSLKGDYFYRNAPQSVPPRAPTLRGEPVAINDDGQIVCIDPPYAAPLPPRAKPQVIKIPSAMLTSAAEAGRDLKLVIRGDGGVFSVEYSFE